MKIYDYNGKKNVCGDRIREARLKQRITQADLAARLQVRGIIIERDSISRIEIGTRFVADYEIIRCAECFARVAFRRRRINTLSIRTGYYFLQKFENILKKTIDIGVRLCYNIYRS